MTGVLWCTHCGYEANLISTIVDKKKRQKRKKEGYEANLISTIVDLQFY